MDTDLYTVKLLILCFFGVVKISDEFTDDGDNRTQALVGLNWQVPRRAFKNIPVQEPRYDVIIRDVNSYSAIIRNIIPPPSYLQRNTKGKQAKLIDDVARNLLVHRGDLHATDIKERNREIKLLQQCLLELEIEYFRMAAENESLKQQQEVEESTYMVPWFRKQFESEQRMEEFEKLDRANVVRMRQFQDQVAIKGFGSALDAQNNALSAAAGIAVNQRSYNDSTHFSESMNHRNKRLKEY